MQFLKNLNMNNSFQPQPAYGRPQTTNPFTNSFTPAGQQPFQPNYAAQTPSQYQIGNPQPSPFGQGMAQNNPFGGSRPGQPNPFVGNPPQSSFNTGMNTSIGMPSYNTLQSSIQTPNKPFTTGTGHMSPSPFTVTKPPTQVPSISTNPFAQGPNQSLAPPSTVNPFQSVQPPTTQSPFQAPPPVQSPFQASQPSPFQVPSTTTQPPFSVPQMTSSAFPSTSQQAFPQVSSTQPKPPQSSSAGFFMNPSGFSATSTAPQVTLPSTAPQTSTQDSSKISKELEDSKKQILSKRRIQDLFQDWKTELDSQALAFREVTEKSIGIEKSAYDCQKEIITLRDVLDKVKSDSKLANETMDLITAEQNDLSGALDVIDKELEKILTQMNIGGFFGKGLRHDDKENIYKAADSVKLNISDLEKNMQKITKSVNDTFETEQENGLDLETILDTYLEALDWIEVNAVNLNSKIENLEHEYHLRPSV
ncbi:unnamed protein product [Blepharisma stoltei]|uniref:Nucleoporin NSP1-like C-terminal domain-containing protein n=1 Tax=Blepharisma stoltei TaxID=1481888 RepID=A0AAU9J9Y1_9CILI|nr:unnamed protein product [Blepharisma stoltei]